MERWGAEAKEQKMPSECARPLRDDDGVYQDPTSGAVHVELHPDLPRSQHLRSSRSERGDAFQGFES